jgi:hypothetical protein
MGSPIGVTSTMGKIRVEKDLEVVPMERIVTALPQDTMGITKMLPDYLVEARLTPLAEYETKAEFRHYFAKKSPKAKLFTLIAKRMIARDSQNTLNAMKRMIEKKYVRAFSDASRLSIPSRDKRSMHL